MPSISEEALPKLGVLGSRGGRLGRLEFVSFWSKSGLKIPLTSGRRWWACTLRGGDMRPLANGCVIVC